jgi:hypothetical protein
VGIGVYVKTPIYLRKRYRERDYFWGGGLPWSLGKRDIVYQKGDCPVAEHRCAHTEMNLGSTGWYEDCTDLMNQIAAAFRKVAQNIGELKDSQERILNAES